jgi:hypothetical protein
MVMHKGGTVVGKGLYWNPLDGQRLTVREDGILPGDGSKSYLKMSPAGLLVIAPLFGMMYVLFLPLFGIGVFLISCLVTAIGTLASVAVPGVRVCGRIAGRSVLFNRRPSRANVTDVLREEDPVCTYTRADRHALYAYLS